MDDYKLIKGEDISESLLQAIEVSRISVIIFSENYAGSSWCLNELVKILECRKLNKQRVIPVFYKVEPAHVRHQTGSFGKALDELKRHADKVHGWRAALTQTANLSGHYYKDGYEADKIREIVHNISRRGTESYNSNPKFVDEEYSLDRLFADEEYPLDGFKQIISTYGQNKVIFYSTRFGSKDCDAVSKALEDSGVEFFKRDVGSSPKFLSELRTLLRGHVRDPAVPCLFVNGRFLGDSKVLIELLKKGTLQKILDGLPKEADGPVCEVCGELRVACSMCSGTGHSFGWIRVSGDLCCDCGGNGLDLPCRTYRCEGGKITETVNNTSYLATESCSSNAEIVYEEYPLDDFKQIISQYGQNKVIFYTIRFGSKDCDAVSKALEDSGVEFFKRDVGSSPKFLSELRTLLRGHVRDPAVPCLFVNGRFLGDSKVLIELLKKGTLQKILDGLPKEADGLVCEVCGELIGTCSKCSGTGHSFGWIRVSGDLCCDCGGNGLDLPCKTYRCEGGKITETVNNISYLGTESCSSNAEIVYEEYPLDDFKQIISRYGQNKVIFYTTMFGSKDCDAVSKALEDSGVEFFKRDVGSSPKFLSELRTLLRGHVRDPAVPCLFVNGRFLGDSKVLIELLKKGTLQKILDGLPKEADGLVCEVCGELIGTCSKCSGTGHSFGWIRVSGDLCCDCGGNGLDLPCKTCRCEGGKITETVNNISYLGTESCSSNAEIVYEEYPLDDFKQIISRYGQNKVIFYTTMFGSKDCDAVSKALEDSGVEFFKRDVGSSPKFLSELRTLLRGHVRDPAVPCLFVNGRFLGDSKVLIELLKKGTLQKILDGLPKEADGLVCEVCGELIGTCSKCSGTGHSFGWIRVSGDLCCDCGGNGLDLPCKTYRCEGGKITETVNNISYLGTESCSSNAEIVYEEYPLDDFKQIISRYGHNKVIFYTTMFGSKDCDAVSTALEDSGVEFFKRDVRSSPKFLSELRTLLRGHVRDPAVPCLFVNGRFLGDAKVLIKLLKKGTLQKILDGLPKEADGLVCEVCGELRVACSNCSGTGHSFGWIRVSGDLCCDCGGNGLDLPCRTYRCEGGKITETVNNISYLGTESCSSNAEIVYEEYPLDDFKQIISRYGQNKVIFYTTMFGSKDCDAVSTALEDSGVEFFKRDVRSSPKFLSELRTLLRGHVRDPAVPCLFVNGRFLGDAKVLIKLLKKGTLQKILDGLPKEADGLVCEVCGELRVACSNCSGTGHSFGWIRVSGDLCCDCGGNGLDLPCRTYRCEGGKITETVNNISYLGTESCSSNAEIVYEEYPLDDFKQIISRYGQNKVIFYTTMFGSKDCDAVSTALEDSGVEFFKRDVRSSPKFLSELRTLLRGHVRDPAVPCLFVNGRFLGDAKVLIELLKKGTLQKILDGLPKEADGLVCEVCGELRVACSMCSGTGHSFGWIRVSGDLCCDCGGNGLDLPCRTYRCEGGKITETVNNTSYLGTESCSSNAEIVYEEYPLDDFKQIISRYGQNKVIFYTTMFGSKDCDAVSTALEDSGVEFFKRDVGSEGKFLSELRTLLRGHVRDPAVPCLFVNGRFLGDAKVLIGLLKKGTLKKILDGLPKEADGPVCEVCGELRVACSMCSGTGHSFGNIRVSGDLCCDCGGNGLELSCRTYWCENHRN